MSERRRGVVLRDEGGLVIVDLDGEEMACVVRKSLRRKTGKRAKAVAVGDRVQVDVGSDGSAIAAVEPRERSISRPDPGRPRREQVLVANLNAVLVVASTRQPDLVPGLIDRFLVAAESRDLDVAIVLNKIDLDPDRTCRAVTDVYRDLGYEVIRASAHTGEGCEQVRAFLQDHITSLLGHSGVGKSSLANALDPTLQLRIGEVHGGTGLGTHTTTTVSLLRLPWGGYLVDTPGIREFGMWRMEPADLAIWFREMADHVDNCRFNDCVHEKEPGCAVLAALEAGRIVPWRYESYRRILQSLRDDTPEAY